MKKIHKRIICVILPTPLVFAITFCCCIDEKASADEAHSSFSMERHQESHELEKSDHDSEHQDHSQEDHGCSCPKHLSFLSAQSADIIFDSALNQMLAKNFMVDVRFKSIFFLASLANQSQGPPLQDHLDHVSIPIYLKNFNLRI